MRKSYFITNRNHTTQGPGDELGEMRYYSTEAVGDARFQFANWNKITFSKFKASLLEEMRAMPLVPESENERQKHVSLFVHGYNNSWVDSIERYATIQDALYSGPESLGVLILFSWPSNGRTTDYLADRHDADASRDALAEVFVDLHEHVVALQRLAVKTEDDQKLCRAKVSVIAHSMGGYLLHRAMAAASQRLNNPQLITLVHQAALVAADVDNDLFQTSKPLDHDGSLMANLCFRITALYSGLDQVLGASAGLKHFGTRRLGRSGLANPAQVWDNVWDVDVTKQIEGLSNSHSAVFRSPAALQLLRAILQGVDRTVLRARL